MSNLKQLPFQLPYVEAKPDVFIDPTKASQNQLRAEARRRRAMAILETDAREAHRQRHFARELDRYRLARQRLQRLLEV